MNVYMVKTKDSRTWEEAICEYGGPTWDYWPHGIFAAETRGRAKTAALYIWSHELSLGVYSDDYVNLRTRLLAEGVEVESGEIGPPEDSKYWLRYHEIEEHAGAPCSCEYAEIAAA